MSHGRIPPASSSANLDLDLIEHSSVQEQEEDQQWVEGLSGAQGGGAGWAGRKHGGGTNNMICENDVHQQHAALPTPASAPEQNQLYPPRPAVRLPFIHPQRDGDEGWHKWTASPAAAIPISQDEQRSYRPRPRKFERSLSEKSVETVAQGSDGRMRSKPKVDRRSKEEGGTICLLHWSLDRYELERVGKRRRATELAQAGLGGGGASLGMGRAEVGWARACVRIAMERAGCSTQWTKGELRRPSFLVPPKNRQRDENKYCWSSSSSLRTSKRGCGQVKVVQKTQAAPAVEKGGTVVIAFVIVCVPAEFHPLLLDHGRLANPPASCSTSSSSAPATSAARPAPPLPQPHPAPAIYGVSLLRAGMRKGKTRAGLRGRTQGREEGVEAAGGLRRLSTSTSRCGCGGDDDDIETLHPPHEARRVFLGYNSGIGNDVWWQDGQMGACLGAAAMRAAMTARSRLGQARGSSWEEIMSSSRTRPPASNTSNALATSAPSCAPRPADPFPLPAPNLPAPNTHPANITKTLPRKLFQQSIATHIPQDQDELALLSEWKELWSCRWSMQLGGKLERPGRKAEQREGGCSSTGRAATTGGRGGRFGNRAPSHREETVGGRAMDSR
ncbi:hypothetical protein GALMADRAFT_217437 [Galerina marginata CBS 339.88]|uniref:Uncharacterized protein n=1 Tax=Galerina marginata (strain CBS 339.88) TaxID=685588 RepID=A0A067S705_GALM3|nr:hypothetical protein GALMADRAFT_217437 [Galerina marginata CBS 339.88]